MLLPPYARRTFAAAVWEGLEPLQSARNKNDGFVTKVSGQRQALGQGNQLAEGHQILGLDILVLDQNA